MLVFQRSKLVCSLTLLLCVLFTSQLAADIISEPWPGGEGVLLGGGSLEVAIETDKTIYQLGETVHVIHTIINPFDVPINNVEFTQEPGFSLLVMLEGIRIWSSNNIALTVIWTRTFEPGEILKLNYAWDMTDYYGNAVLPGEYELIGAIHGEGRNVSTNITIVPEPASLSLLVLGGLGFLRSKRRKL